MKKVYMVIAGIVIVLSLSIGTVTVLNHDEHLNQQQTVTKIDLPYDTEDDGPIAKLFTVPESNVIHQVSGVHITPPGCGCDHENHN